jgi:hypothetical protein
MRRNLEKAKIVIKGLLFTDISIAVWGKPNIKAKLSGPGRQFYRLL